MDIRWIFNNDCSAKLMQFFEYWLRLLRDIHGVDYYQYFQIDHRKLTIAFCASLSPEEGQAFVNSINAVITYLRQSGLEIKVNSRHGPATWGLCSFELHFTNLKRWSIPTIASSEETAMKLYQYGNALGRKLFQNIATPANRNPLTWRVEQTEQFPGVWLFLEPAHEFLDYPSVGEELAYDVQLVQSEFFDPQFKVARFVQTERVAAILFDYREN